MKRLLIGFLCVAMLLQSGIDVRAAEEVMEEETTEEVIPEEIMEEETTDEVLSEEENIEEETTEEVIPEEIMAEETTDEALSEEKVIEKEISEEEFVDEKSIEEEIEVLTAEEAEYADNTADDPQYGRANGYGFEEDVMDIPVLYGTYTHDSRFEKYAKKDVIDVSSYQKSIDWAKVKAAGIDYAIIRVGFRGWGQEGNFGTDARYKENIKNATAAGVKVGVYIFSQATTTAEAKEEAEFVLKNIQGYDISLPVVLDYEYASGSSGLYGRLYDAKLSVSAATKICKAFCEKIQSQGYTPMVYANKSMLENNLNAAEIAKDYKIWLARYNSYAGYSGDYEFWQYTDTGSVSGITGNVDKNFWYVDPNAWKNPVGKNVKISDTLANRLYGSNRYVTSFEIANALQSEIGGSKFSHIIVANGRNFADALSGSYLAGIKNAPIIITNGNNAQDVRNYINNHVKKGGKVYILGGTAAVPEGVGCGLSDYTVKRIKGSDRYKTNIEILKEAGVSAKEILVCTGEKFADSLSGSATGKPMLLVKGSSLSSEQKSYLSSLKGKTFYILGGTGAVSGNIEKELKKYGTVTRISGTDRYETSVKIAETFFKSPTEIVMASAGNFPDGLCGGPFALKKKAPLILTQTKNETKAKAYAKKYGIHKGSVLGGSNEKLVNDATVKNILGKLSEIENQAAAKIIKKSDGTYDVNYEVVMGEKASADQNFYLMRADGYSGSLMGSPVVSVKKKIM